VVGFDLKDGIAAEKRDAALDIAGIERENQHKTNSILSLRLARILFAYLDLSFIPVPNLLGSIRR
jgi:hypothetical protein